MTSTATLSLGASSTSANWDAIKWQSLEVNVRRLQMRIAKATRAMDVVTGSDLGPLKGLSRVKGNFHARFLGEGMAARSFPYPTCSFREPSR